MVDWKSPEVLSLCAALFTRMIVFLLGAYTWFIMESWHIVEGALVTGRTKFALIHIPYLFARYGQLITLVLVCIMTQLSSHNFESCQSIGFMRAAVIAGCIAVAAASANLGLRAYTIWKNSVIVRVAMVLGCLGHLAYAMIMGFLTVQAVWSADHTQCVLLTTTYEHIIIGFFIYSTTWDTIILSFTIMGLRKVQHRTLANVLKAQGVGYAAVTWLMSIPVAAVLVLNLNSSINTSFSAPGATISVIASSKMVVSLLKPKNEENEGENSDPESHSSETNPNFLTTNIHLTEFNPSSSDTESVSMREKNVEEVQSDPLRKVVLEDCSCECGSRVQG